MSVWLHNGSIIRPRDEAFALYWHFASERQAIFHRRLANETGPWTADPTLSTYKFCNTFRVADRVSQFLVDKVLYARADDTSTEDQVFRALVFRFFSREATWEHLERVLGPVTVKDFCEAAFAAALDDRRASGSKLYTGAFILCANAAFGRPTKHANHAALFTHIANDEQGVLTALVNATSVGDLYSTLIALPLIGQFMAYQIAIDINYGPAFGFDESSFVAAGPGAVRGIRKCFESTGALSDAALIQWVQANQVELAASYDRAAPTLFGRPLQSIDCQGLFCETDKYCRVALPGLVSQRKQIKAVLRPNDNITTLVVPPHWNLDTTLDHPKLRAAILN
jgi:5-hmdU DNA kinase-like protein